MVDGSPGKGGGVPDDEGNPNPPLVQVVLGPPEAAAHPHHPVRVALAAGEGGSGAVIAGEDDDGVLLQAEVAEPIQQPPHLQVHPVQLGQVVPHAVVQAPTGPLGAVEDVLLGGAEVVPIHGEAAELLDQGGVRLHGRVGHVLPNVQVEGRSVRTVLGCPVQELQGGVVDGGILPGGATARPPDPANVLDPVRAVLYSQLLRS